MKKKVEASYPGVAVDGKVGRASSFEITINDNLVFSKLKSGGFPDEEEVNKQIEAAMSGQPTSLVEKTASGGGCVIM